MISREIKGRLFDLVVNVVWAETDSPRTNGGIPAADEATARVGDTVVPRLLDQTCCRKVYADAAAVPIPPTSNSAANAV